MVGRLVLGVVLSLAAQPALARFVIDVRCAASDDSLVVLIGLAHDEDRQAWSVEDVVAGTADGTLATSDYDHLAYQAVTDTRIELGLRDGDRDPIALTMVIVRDNRLDGRGPESVAAGIVAGDYFAPTNVECTGWF